MQFVEKLVDWFNAFAEWCVRLITRVFGSSNERRVSQLGYVREKDGTTKITPGSVIDRINQLEPELEKRTDAELEETSTRLRARLQGGETLDDILPDAFAAVRESGRRNLKMRHYDVQLLGGYILHKGMIAEMVTGEGKTLVATLASYLNALDDHVHIVTVNDYLAQRDMEWMGPVHMALGLTVGAIQSQMDPPQRQKAYACDITYGTNNEFGFDYLRDNMKPREDLQVQGKLAYAVIDEVDNILIDEARTPLIISGPAQDDLTKYSKANRVALQLKRDVDFEVKEKEHTCHLTEEGIRHAEELAGVESFYTAGNMEWPHLIDNALKAHFLYKRDVNYVVENDEVVIVDEFTGRKMPGRQWSDGLHQAGEAKEGVRIKEESQTLATITLQNYFKLYKKLSGMTGTAMTEADEFWKIYKLDVVSVPTNRPLARINYPDLIYRTEKEKWTAVTDEIREIHATHRPVLVGTVSIEKSELLSSKLNKFGIKHNLLNAKHHEREAEIVAQAGRKNAVTISTNMAGRGTDIILGGNPEHMAWEELSQKYESRLEVPKLEWDEVSDKISKLEGMEAEGREVAELGGLHVIGTERHDARRIDLQLRGRSGRQGDPGSSRFFLSLEDDLMRIFAGDWVKNMLTRLGMQDGEAIESRIVSKRVQGAQKKREEMHFEQRKHLLEYDEVMDEQRKQVYSYRQRILDGTNCRGLILDMIDEHIDRWVPNFLSSGYRWDTIVDWAMQSFHIELQASDIRDMDKPQLVQNLGDEARRQAEDHLQEQIDINLPEDTEEVSSPGDWQALSKFANGQWGLNTNDRELKKIGREQLMSHLTQRASESIARYDFSLLDDLLADTLGNRSVCGWVHQQYGISMDHEDLDGMDSGAVVEHIRDTIQGTYHEKEVMFPVTVGLSRFAGERQSSGQRLDREGLREWANGRFGMDLDTDEFGRLSRAQIMKSLTDGSRQYLDCGKEIDKVDEYLDQVYGERNGRASRGDRVQNTDSLQKVTSWANENFDGQLEASDLEDVTRETARQRVLHDYDRRFRPELAHVEQSIILEILDTSWKDHLYFMDHLRSGIGLVGYAQKDPKVEYKREGMKAFEETWERIGQQVTTSIFRVEMESQFTGSVWDITSTTKEDASDDMFRDEYSDQDSREPGQTSQTIEPIRNRTPKVGRNDLCPCGSGKKYKKCCGKE